MISQVKSSLSFLRPDHFFQAFLIFLSVFLATLAGNWNESRKETARTTEFLIRLNDELTENRGRIDTSISYHSTFASVSDSLFLLLNQKKIPARFVDFGGSSAIPGWRGTGFASLDNSIYQSGMMGGVLSNLPMDLLSQLSRLKKAEEGYRKFSEELFQRMVNIKMDTQTSEWLIILNFLGGDVYRLEKRIAELTAGVQAQIQIELEKR